MLVLNNRIIEAHPCSYLFIFLIDSHYIFNIFSKITSQIKFDIFIDNHAMEFLILYSYSYKYLFLLNMVFAKCYKLINFYISYFFDNCS